MFYCLGILLQSCEQSEKNVDLPLILRVTLLTVLLSFSQAPSAKNAQANHFLLNNLGAGPDDIPWKNLKAFFFVANRVYFFDRRYAAEEPNRKFLIKFEIFLMNFLTLILILVKNNSRVENSSFLFFERTFVFYVRARTLYFFIFRDLTRIYFGSLVFWNDRMIVSPLYAKVNTLDMR